MVGLNLYHVPNITADPNENRLRIMFDRDGEMEVLVGHAELHVYRDLDEGLARCFEEIDVEASCACSRMRGTNERPGHIAS